MATVVTRDISTYGQIAVTYQSTAHVNDARVKTDARCRTAAVTGQYTLQRNVAVRDECSTDIYVAAVEIEVRHIRERAVHYFSVQNDITLIQQRSRAIYR